jgi:hypothetical protein
MAEKTTEHRTLKIELPSHWRSKAAMICVRRWMFDVRRSKFVPPILPANRLIYREVLECGGWRGTGLTALSTKNRGSMLDVRCSMFDVSPTSKAVCALTPHPPQSKTLARLPKPFPVQERTARKEIHAVLTLT